MRSHCSLTLSVSWQFSLYSSQFPFARVLSAAYACTPPPRCKQHTGRPCTKLFGWLAGTLPQARSLWCVPRCADLLQRQACMLSLSPTARMTPAALFSRMARHWLLNVSQIKCLCSPAPTPPTEAATEARQTAPPAAACFAPFTWHRQTLYRVWTHAFEALEQFCAAETAALQHLRAIDTGRPFAIRALALYSCFLCSPSFHTSRVCPPALLTLPLLTLCLSRVLGPQAAHLAGSAI